MTCDKNTVTRSNFASRLLSKAMSERTKTGEINKSQVIETATPSFAVERNEPVAAGK